MRNRYPYPNVMTVPTAAPQMNYGLPPEVAAAGTGPQASPYGLPMQLQGPTMGTSDRTPTSSSSNFLLSVQRNNAMKAMQSAQGYNRLAQANPTGPYAQQQRDHAQRDQVAADTGFGQMGYGANYLQNRQFAQSADQRTGQLVDANVGLMGSQGRYNDAQSGLAGSQSRQNDAYSQNVLPAMGANYASLATLNNANAGGVNQQTYARQSMLPPEVEAAGLANKRSAYGLPLELDAMRAQIEDQRARTAGVPMQLQQQGALNQAQVGLLGAQGDLARGQGEYYKGQGQAAVAGATPQAPGLGGMGPQDRLKLDNDLRSAAGQRATENSHWYNSPLFSAPRLFGFGEQNPTPEGEYQKLQQQVAPQGQMPGAGQAINLPTPAQMAEIWRQAGNDPAAAHRLALSKGFVFPQQPQGSR